MVPTIQAQQVKSPLRKAGVIPDRLWEERLQQTREHTYSYSSTRD